MYHCLDCEKKFAFVKIEFETHGLDTPPFERRRLCPHCDSGNIIYKEEPHCRYCGSRLRRGGEYCSALCRSADRRQREREEKNREFFETSPVVGAVREVDTYNKAHGTRLTYGQYFALKEGGHI